MADAGFDLLHTRSKSLLGTSQNERRALKSPLLGENLQIKRGILHSDKPEIRRRAFDAMRQRRSFRTVRRGHRRTQTREVGRDFLEKFMVNFHKILRPAIRHGFELFPVNERVRRAHNSFSMRSLSHCLIMLW